MRPSGRTALLILVALAACGAPQTPEIIASAPPPPEDPLPCATAARERERAPALFAQGRLDRTVRVLERADALCPKSAADTWALLATALSDLGRDEEALRVAGAIEASKEASAAAREAAKKARQAAGQRGRSSFQTLLQEGLVTKARGDKAAAQRLFDRAMVEVERVTGKKVVADVPGGIKDEVASIAVRPDGSALALATGNVVSIRDSSKGYREVMQIDGHEGSVNHVAYSPDGRFLATGSSDKRARIWDAATGALVHTLVGHTKSVNVVAFSPDGATLASGSGDTSVRLWSAATGDFNHALTGLTQAVLSIAFSPNGKTVAGGAGFPLLSVSLVTGTPTDPPQELLLRIWDAKSGALLRDMDGEAWALTFSPDGRTLAATREEVYLWTLDKKASSRALPTVSKKSFWDRTSALAYSPDGKLLAAGSDDKVIRLFNLSSRGDPVELKGHTGAITSVAFSSNGQTLISGSKDGTVRFWAVASGVESAKIQGHPADKFISPIAFSPDKKALAVGAADGSLRLVSLGPDSGPLMRKLDWSQGPALDITYSRDGKTIAERIGTTTVLVRSLVTGAETSILTGKSGSVSSIALSPDGAVLATGSADRAAHLWSVATKSELKKLVGHTKWVRAVAFSPDGKLLATGSADASVRLWDVAAGQEVKKLVSHNRDVLSLAFSADGAKLASSSNDYSVSLWSVATGQELKMIQGHANAVRSVAWSSDQAMIATCSSDGTVRLWGADSGVEKRYLEAPKSVDVVAFSPSGNTVVASSEDEVHVWTAGGDKLVVFHPIFGKNAAFCRTIADPPLVELMGEEMGEDAVCRAGILTFPFDLCRERFEVTGLFEKALAGDMSYADP